MDMATSLDFLTSPRSRDEWLSGELRQILDALPSIVFVAEDPDCQSIFANAAGERLLSVRRGANVSKSSPKGELPRQFNIYDSQGLPIAPEDLPIQRAARGEIVRDLEEEIRFEDGECVWLVGNAVPLRDSEGRIWGAVGAFSDITSLKRTELELLRANDAKSRLLEVISHDLRQPVQGLMLFSEVLSSHVDETGTPTWNKVRNCIDLLSRQLENLLDFARVDSGVLTVRPEAVELETIVMRAAAPAQALAQSKGIELKLRPTNAVVLTDPVLMERVLANLVSNAVKYTVRGKVLVGYRRCGHDRLRVQVVDTGVGIPPEHLDQIWDNYFQVRGGQGVGLGLAIVDRTARLLGSTISVRSTLGRGTVFSVDIPLKTMG